MSLKLAVLGLPGAGKGTQAGKLSDAYSIPHISMGDILRNNKDFETDSGDTVGEIIDAGNPVSAETCAALLSRRLDRPDCANGFVLDGFPRYEEQAEIMAEVAEIDALLVIEVDEDNILERLTKRRICPECDASYHLTYDPPEEDGRCDECGSPLKQREDDTAEKIQERIEWQRDGLNEVLDVFADDDSVPIETVDGNQAIDAVWDDVQEVTRQYVDD
jgi:adenylate kinase